MHNSPHQYELDMRVMMDRLGQELERNGYVVTQTVPGAVWRFETRWSRGAAYGEIGSLLYYLVSQCLREIES